MLQVGGTCSRAAGGLTGCLVWITDPCGVHSNILHSKPLMTVTSLNGQHCFEYQSQVQRSSGTLGNRIIIFNGYFVKV